MENPKIFPVNCSMMMCKWQLPLDTFHKLIHNCIHGHIPWAYILSYLAYTVILYKEHVQNRLYYNNNIISESFEVVLIIIIHGSKLVHSCVIYYIDNLTFLENPLHFCTY